MRALHLPGHTLGMTNPLVDDRYPADRRHPVHRHRSAAPTWAAGPRPGRRCSSVPCNGCWPCPTTPSCSRPTSATWTRRTSRAATAPPSARCAAATRACACWVRDWKRSSPTSWNSLPEHPPTYDDIRRVNTGLLQVDEAKASELELGRNQCALTHGGTGPHPAA